MTYQHQLESPEVLRCNSVGFSSSAGATGSFRKAGTPLDGKRKAGGSSACRPASVLAHRCRVTTRSTVHSRSGPRSATTCPTDQRPGLGAADTYPFLNSLHIFARWFVPTVPSLFFFLLGRQHCGSFVSHARVTRSFEAALSNQLPS